MMDYYEILEIPKNASKEEIENAYIKLAKKYHPNSRFTGAEPDEEKFKEILEAYDALSGNGPSIDDPLVDIIKGESTTRFVPRSWRVAGVEFDERTGKFVTRYTRNPPLKRKKLYRSRTRRSYRRR